MTTDPTKPGRNLNFLPYRRKQIAELRPYVVGEVLAHRVSISAADLEAGSPKRGDMIARNPKNHEDQWLVAAAYFAENFEPLTKPGREDEAAGLDIVIAALESAAVEKPHAPFRPILARFLQERDREKNNAWAEQYIAMGAKAEAALAAARQELEQAREEVRVLGLTNSALRVEKEQSQRRAQEAEALVEAFKEAAHYRIIAGRGYIAEAKALRERLEVLESALRAIRDASGGHTNAMAIAALALARPEQEPEPPRDSGYYWPTFVPPPLPGAPDLHKFVEDADYYGTCKECGQVRLAHVPGAPEEKSEDKP